MKENTPVPSELRLVSTVPFPEHIFACFARIKPEAGAALKSVYYEGKKPPKILGDSFTLHLIYNYNLSEKGLIWEAGPSTDFTEILYIYSTSDIDEARRLLHNDPFFLQGLFLDDWCFEWTVHVPIWKLNPPTQEMIKGLLKHVNIIPTYPAGIEPVVNEIKVNPVTPQRLFVSISDAMAEQIKQNERDEQSGKPVPSFFINHAFNRLGPGGTVQMGYDWEAGPSLDQNYDLTIMSVASMQMAQQLRENDPVSQQGLFYNHRYFEWCILMPFNKVSPGYKDVMKNLLKNAGIEVPPG